MANANIFRSCAMPTVGCSSRIAAPIQLGSLDGSFLDRVAMRCLIVGLALTLAGCSSVIDAVEQEPSPDITKAKPNIITIASQYHLPGLLQIAGPIEAHPVSLTPWVNCLRGASEARFMVAVLQGRHVRLISRIDNRRPMRHPELPASSELTRCAVCRLNLRYARPPCASSSSSVEPASGIAGERQIKPDCSQRA
jgi:hypothetical protein